MAVSTMSDSEFKKYIQRFREEITKIKLPQDINSITGQYILSELDNIYTLIRYDLSDIETSYERTESIIRQHERTKTEGRNEEERKKNASLYLEAFPVGEDDTVNMYDWNRLLYTRYKMIKALVDIIENKQQRLITMNGFLKIDKHLGSQFQGE